MDLDAYVLAHSSEWGRLDELTRRRRLSGAEADELVEGYQQVATHLSVVRTSAPDPSLVAHLSSLLSRARNRAVGTRTSTWAGVGSFLAVRFPAALYRQRRWWLGCMAVSLAVTTVMVLWLLAHPMVEQSLLSPAEVDQLVNEDFEGYYSQYAASHFAAQVWINNAWVTALCLALGILGLPVIYLLFTNILNLAVIGSIMIRNDRADLFFGLILPHGLLELDGGLRGRGRGAEAVLVVGRAGRPHPDGVGRPRGTHRRHRGARPGRGAAGQRRHRGVRDAVGPAHLGADRHRGPRGAVLPRRRLRARPQRRPARPDR